MSGDSVGGKIIEGLVEAVDIAKLQKENKRLRKDADANICCPECGFIGPAKDWEISALAPARSDT